MSVVKPGARAALALAAQEAEQLGSATIDIEHLFLGLCRVEDVHFLVALAQAGLDPVHARRRLRVLWRNAHPSEAAFSGHRTPRCRDVFARAAELGNGTIDPADLMRAALETASPAIDALLSEFHLTRRDITRALSAVPAAETADELAAYGRDLTQLARDGRLAAAVGRDEETKRVARILLQAKKGNPLLVGDPGVGKTAIVESLAVRLAGPVAPSGLRGIRLVEISLGALVAGTKHRGEFEERLESIIKRAETDRSLVLFIDEVHLLLGAGAGGGTMDAANLLKPALARGKMRVIGATTTNEYRRYIEKDPALERRFQTVWIEEPPRDTAIEILNGLRPTLQAHHGVSISTDAIHAAVDLSIRFLPEFRLPDKAIDLVDQACARALLASFSPETAALQSQDVRAGIGPEAIAAVVADRCRVPIEKLTVDESRRLLEMEDHLTRRVAGQPEAVNKVAEVVRTARAGLKDPRRPVGVFLFLGPTGTGKTELAKAVAEFLFGDERRLIRIDMSEYGEKQMVNRLIGSPPGYIGHDEGGQLTDRVRDHPYSVVLFDEIEKAHPDVLDLLLPILDEGHLTDSRGRRASFAETVIILTSNLVPDQVGTLRPELLNRIQHVVVFRPLTREAMRSIAGKIVGRVQEQLLQRSIRLKLTEPAYAVLMQHGCDARFGAREMERAVDRLLVQPLAKVLLEGAFGNHATIRVDADDDHLTFAADAASITPEG